MSNKTNGTDERKVVTLRELQPILRKVFDKNLILDNFTTDNFLPFGENYGSTIQKVHAVIRRSENAEPEDLFMIAKMAPPTAFQRAVFESSRTFPKEIYMYEHIIPLYKRLEKEQGVDEKEQLDLLPKYYGSRLSLDSNVEFDDDAVLLMENLKVRGYYTGKRAIGYDLEHCELGIRALARFHALGIATRQHYPNEFEAFKKHAKNIVSDMTSYKKVCSSIVEVIREEPQTRCYADRCKKVLLDEKLIEEFHAPPPEPWQTVVHFDFWVNNVMFHRDEKGHVDDVKFVDFQNYIISSPMRELIFFIFSSGDDSVYKQNVDYLIDLYYDTFVFWLKRLNCEVSFCTRGQFDARIAIDAQKEFLHLCFMLKLVTLHTEETEFDQMKMHKLLIEHKGSQVFQDKLRKLVLHFILRDWI